MKKYIMSIDLGTTSIRVILFDKLGAIKNIEQKEISLITPKPGWVEQDAIEIYNITNELIKTTLSNVDINEIDSIGITNQRETTVIWDEETGEVVYNAIVWQSKQTIEICEDLISAGHRELFKEKTGLPIDSYFSGTKIKWILETIDIKYENIMFGTLDTWILWNLTNKEVYATDHTNASRTMIYNIHELKWDAELIDILGISRVKLPKVCPSSYDYGFYSYGNMKIRISAIAGDQQAALFGQTCFEPGIIKSTYGTGCFLMMNTISAVNSNKGLLTTIAYSKDNIVEYALEGSIFVAGSAINWLINNLGIIKTAEESEGLSTQISNTGGVYFVPSFSGLGTPYWDMDAKGAIFGLTHSTTKKEIVRATIESICYRTKDVVDIMCEETNTNLKSLRVDGGMTKNKFFNQFQSDILNINVDVPFNSETTALGVAYMAGLQTGFYKSKEEIKKLWKIKKRYYSMMDEGERKDLYDGWQKVINAVINL